MVGQLIGAYRIIAKVGEGGMGAVYLGEHQRIARKAAIKVLLPEFSANPQIVARFFNEARATSLIRHPGIVEIADCDVLPNGNAYIVMELLEGESLGSLLRRGERLSVHRSVLLARHIADALAAAHGQGIVHRDLKPDNVFLLQSGAGTSASQPLKILDFGIAKLVDKGGGGDGNLKTRTGVILGTPIYMSPEQCRGVGEIDYRTDIYSLGCILFEMISGRPPFTSEGFGELIQAHLSVTPPTLKSVDGNIPDAVDALVARMLAKAPRERPQTMRGLATELEAAISGAPEMMAAARAGGTVVYDNGGRPAKASTTLRSAASEKRSAPRTGEALTLPSRKRIRVGITIGAGAMTLAAGGMVAWRLIAMTPVGSARGDGMAAAVPSRISEPFNASPSTPPLVVPAVAESPAPSLPTPEAAPAQVGIKTQEPVAAKAPSPAAALEAKRPVPVAPRKVRILIASEPSGAEVCLAKDRLLLGRTKFEWSPEKGARSAKLLIRKRGYRGEEVTVATDRDTKKEVSLSKLGPDDIDDTDTCEKR